MAFRTGSVSYARFLVNGEVPAGSPEDLIAALEANASPPGSGEGPAPEVQAGWCAGQHVFDATFDRTTIGFGPWLVFGIRLDVNRVPGEIRRAYQAEAEAAARKARPDGRLSGGDRRQCRDEASDRARREMMTGRFRQSTMIPVMWAPQRRLLLTPVFSDSRRVALDDLFKATFERTLVPMSAGAMAREILGRRGETRAYEDATPTPYTPPPPSASVDDLDRDMHEPAVQWAMAGPEPSDFLGNELLIWLWWHTIEHAGVVDTDAGPVGIVLDRTLDMSCAWEVTGKQSLRADGPTRLPEAGTALRLGKWPRKAGMILECGGAQWGLTFQADRFLVSGARLPRDEDVDPKNPRDIIEARIESIESLDGVLVALYEAFLADRIGDRWPATRQSMSRWIRGERAGVGSGMKVEVMAGV